MCAECTAASNANAARFRSWYARAKAERSPSYLRVIERARRAATPTLNDLSVRARRKKYREAILASAERRRA